LEAVEASCSPSERHGGDSKKRRALILAGSRVAF
jgi:hypothetical protein